MSDLTEKQRAVFEYLKDYQSNPATPTTNEICDHFNIKNMNTAVCHLDALEKKGYIHRHNGKCKIDILKEKNRTDGWISVDTALPEVDQPVMTYSDDGFTDEIYKHDVSRIVMTNDTDWCWFAYKHNAMLTKVTHWKPLTPPVHRK